MIAVQNPDGTYDIQGPTLPPISETAPYTLPPVQVTARGGSFAIPGPELTPSGPSGIQITGPTVAALPGSGSGAAFGMSPTVVVVAIAAALAWLVWDQRR